MHGFPGLNGRLLVLFDGHCTFCNASVQWLQRRDRAHRLLFLPADSPAAANFLLDSGFLLGSGLSPHSTEPPQNTIIVIRPIGTNPAGNKTKALAREALKTEDLVLRSDAVLALLAELPRPWPMISQMLGWLPRWLRDGVYRFVAHWRSVFNSRVASCPCPPRSKVN